MSETKFEMRVAAQKESGARPAAALKAKVIHPHFDLRSLQWSGRLSTARQVSHAWLTTTEKLLYVPVRPSCSIQLSLSASSALTLGNSDGQAS